MPVIINPDSELARELAKWEIRRPFAPYPRMVFRALPNPLRNGQVTCGESMNTDLAESFSKQCQMVVQSEDEDVRAVANGWARSPSDALLKYEQQEQALSTAAAEAAYAAQRMTSKAQAERVKRDGATDKHLGE